MKVKVSYTVDFDNIPDVVKQILDDINKHVKNLQDSNEYLMSCQDYGVSCLKKINSARESLYYLVDLYDDSQNLIKGYITNSISQEQELTSNQESQTPEQRLENEDDLS